MKGNKGEWMEGQEEGRVKERRKGVSLLYFGIQWPAYVALFAMFEDLVRKINRTHNLLQEFC